MLKRYWAVVGMVGFALWGALAAQAQEIGGARNRRAFPSSQTAAAQTAAAQMAESSARNFVPVFGQLVSFALPEGFGAAFENTKDDFYIWQGLPAGETMEKWTQMLIMTGMKGLVANPNANPEAVVSRVAAGFKRACPDTFAASSLDIAKLGGNDAFGALVSCGTAIPASPSAAPYSETVMVIALKGAQNYYTLQWSERGAALATPAQMDAQKWLPRFRLLDTVKLCPLIPGETAPYPSCR